MSLIRKNGNRIEFFDNLNYCDYENQLSICKFFTEKDRYNQQKLDEIKKLEKLKCVVNFKYIHNIYLDKETKTYTESKMEHKIDFEKDILFLEYNNFEICFTENFMIFYVNTQNNNYVLQLFNIKFTDSLKEHIINYFSNKFLEEYQNEIYKKCKKHIFNIKLLNYIVISFNELYLNTENDDQICEENEESD